MLAAHENGWRQRWAIADVVIEGNDAAQQGIRFNLFQLFSTYYGEDARLNIGPKGFTGEKYGGATLATPEKIIEVQSPKTISEFLTQVLSKKSLLIGRLVIPLRLQK